MDKSSVPIPVKLEYAAVSYYIIVNDVVVITSIIVEPLSVNVNSMINLKEKLPYLENDNRIFLNEIIIDTLLDFRFDVSNLKFWYQISKIDSVHFVLSQYMFHVEISEIVLTTKMDLK